MEIFSSWLASGIASAGQGGHFPLQWQSTRCVPALTSQPERPKCSQGKLQLCLEEADFFSFLQLPFYYYGVLWTAADELCFTFMKIQLLSSFIPSWGVLMGTKWKDCCDSHATLGSPRSRGPWANLDVKAASLCCSFHPDRIIMCSSANHTLLKSSLGKHMLLQSLAVGETLPSWNCCDSSQLLSSPLPTPAWIQNVPSPSLLWTQRMHSEDWREAFIRPRVSQMASSSSRGGLY